MYIFSSGLFLVEKDFSRLLGGVTLDPSTGRVLSASAAVFEFIGVMNGTRAKEEGIAIDNALGELVSVYW